MRTMTVFNWIVLSMLVSPLAAMPGLTPTARADWQALPKNSHQLYETYGLFNDNQTTMIARPAAMYWGGLGGSFALVGNPDVPAHPQFVILAAVYANMIFDQSGRIYSDEIDVHAGGAFEFALNPMMRLSLGAIHYSGHVADGAIDQDLLNVNYNLGDNMLFARFVYDLGNYVRAGGTFIPVIHGGPDMNFFGANQFAELFPLGGQDESQKPSPYLAMGLEEGGTSQYGMQVTYNVQAGIYMGNHFANEWKPTMRALIGYYTGADPRLKYFQFKNANSSFFYGGFMFDF